MNELPSSPMPVQDPTQHLISRLQELSTSLPESPKLPTPPAGLGLTPELLDRLTATW